MQNFQVTPIGKINANEEGVFIELEPKYIPAMQALDGFSHLSVIWWFSDSDHAEMRNIIETPQPYKNAPAVMGIFATRSPVLDIKPYTPSLDRVEAPGVPKWCSHWPKSLEQSEDFDWENEFNF